MQISTGILTASNNRLLCVVRGLCGYFKRLDGPAKKLPQSPQKIHREFFIFKENRDSNLLGLVRSKKEI